MHAGCREHFRPVACFRPVAAALDLWCHTYCHCCEHNPHRRVDHPGAGEARRWEGLRPEVAGYGHLADQRRERLSCPAHPGEAAAYPHNVGVP
eukprot:scaffold346_cov387-Prasinococcus_capsulatus_cf.AAC.14